MSATTVPVLSPGALRRAKRKSSLESPVRRDLKVVAGYLRLTVDPYGDKSGYDTQKKEILVWAKKNHYRVVWFQDKDITAADDQVKRPQYEEMLARVADGEFAGVVAWRLDRLLRLTRDLHKCLAILKKAGAFLASATEPVLNTNGPSGEIVMSLLVMVAEIEIKGMRIRALAHQQHRSEKGLLSGAGLRPFGFVGAERAEKQGVIINKQDALKTHVPREAELLREAARRIAREGASYPQIIKEWAERKPPVVGTQGKPFEVSKLRSILTSPRVAGLREYNIYDDEGELIEVGYADAEWKAIIDRETWEILRDRGRPFESRETKRGLLLTGGIAQCGRCGRPMVAGGTQKTGTKELVPNYRCNKSVNARQLGACGSLEVQAGHLERTVLDVLFERLDETPELHDLVNAADPAEDVVRTRAELMREIRECDDRLSELSRVGELGRSHPDYQLPSELRGAKEGVRQRREAADRALRKVKSQWGIPAPTDEERKDVRAWFEKLSVSEKRSWLAAHLTGVIVAPAAKRSRYFDPGRVTPLFADAKDAGRAGE